jgi:ribosomal protein S18 acetylase RimI-like enzyme
VPWRPATPADDEAIATMCLALNQEDPGPRPVDAAQVRRTLAALRVEPVRGRAVVLEEAGSPAGYALLVSFWSNELGGEICNVDELWVAPALRGQGHATALLRSLMSGHGPWPRVPVAIELEVNPRNPRARALYQALGFEPYPNAMLRWRP